MAGEFLYFSIYVLQQLGVMLGVGAQTILLCTHLVAVHRSEAESGKASYARAARAALGAGLFLIIVSGAAAVTLHVLNNQLSTVLTPAFLFKWMLIVFLMGAFLTTRSAISNNALYALTGGTWYALFLVHSLAPVTSWVTLIELYVAWMATFAVVWAAFVGFMHWRRTPASVSVQMPIVKKEIPKDLPKMPPPVATAAPVRVAAPPPPPTPKPVVVSAPPPPPPPKPIPPPAPIAPPPPPAPKPIVIKEAPKVPPAPAPVSVAMAPVVPKPSKISWWARVLKLFARRKSHVAPSVPSAPSTSPLPQAKPSVPVHTPLSIAKPAPAPVAPTPAPILPVLQPLSLESAHTTPSMPASVPVPPPVASAPQKTFLEEVIDHLHVPALRIMPQRVEDIGKQNRPPVVKLGDLE